jgi:hypothetical protein
MGTTPPEGALCEVTVPQHSGLSGASAKAVIVVAVVIPTIPIAMMMVVANIIANFIFGFIWSFG